MVGGRGARIGADSGHPRQEIQLQSWGTIPTMWRKDHRPWFLHLASVDKSLFGELNCALSDGYYHAWPLLTIC